MKPYGVQIIEEPDVADIQKMAAKSSCGNLPGKNGEYRGWRRSASRKEQRRYWKRQARKLAKLLCEDY